MTSQTVLTLWAWLEAILPTASPTIPALPHQPSYPEDLPSWEQQ